MSTLRIARKAKAKDKGKVKKELAIQRTGEKPTAEAKESPRRRLLQGLGANPDAVEGVKGSVGTPAPVQSLEEKYEAGARGPSTEGSNGFAR
jgi:hypothetical protein